MAFRPNQGSDLTPLLLQTLLQQRRDQASQLQREEARKDRLRSGALQIAINNPDLAFDTALAPLVDPRGELEPAAQAAIKKAQSQAKKARDEQQGQATARTQLGSRAAGETQSGLSALTANAQEAGGGPNQEQAVAALNTALQSLASSGFQPSVQQSISQGAIGQAAADQRARAQQLEIAPVTQFFDRNGKPTVAAQRGSPEFKAALDRGDVTGTIGLTGTPEDIFGDTVGRRDALQNFQNTINAAAQAASVRRTVRRADPAAFGARGNIARFVGRLAGQFDPGDVNGWRDTVLSEIANTSVEESRSLEVQALRLAALSVPIFTGEQSGRITKEELRIAQRAVGLLSNITTKRDAEQAMNLIQTMHLSNLHMQSMRLGRPLFKTMRVDNRGEVVPNEPGLVKLANRARKDGLDDAAITELLAIVQDQEKDFVELEQLIRGAQ